MKPRIELGLIGLALLALNLPMLFGHSATGIALALFPDAVANGEWWRLVTHPFTHVSWYHLLLDGTAFVFLFASLTQSIAWKRWAYVAGAALGSAGISWLTSPALSTQGLCGLSGIDHGLMAVTSLEMMTGPTADRATRRVGLLSLGLVLAKAGVEAITGQAFLSWMHFGLMGSPIAVCHAGGVLGALLTYALVQAICPRPAQPVCLQGRGTSNTLPSPA